MSLLILLLQELWRFLQFSTSGISCVLLSALADRADIHLFLSWDQQHVISDHYIRRLSPFLITGKSLVQSWDRGSSAMLSLHPFPSRAPWLEKDGLSLLHRRPSISCTYTSKLINASALALALSLSHPATQQLICFARTYFSNHQNKEQSWSLGPMFLECGPETLLNPLIILRGSEFNEY